MQNAERAENVTEPSNEAKAVSTPTEVIFFLNLWMENY